MPWAANTVILALAEREDIMVHWKNRVGVSEIARLVGRDKSTVSREIRRNGWYSPVAGRMWCYRASTAHDKSQRRARRCRRQPLLADPRRLELVARLIRDRHWSPEQIEGRIMIERPDLGVSDTTIYRAVHSGLLDHTLGGHNKMSARLRHRRRRRKGRLDGRGRITITHELGERPAIADRRERVGDWEGDTVAGRMSGAVLVTLVDRATGYLVGGKAPSKRAVDVSLVIEQALAPHTVAPSPWTGATSSPSAPPFKNHWAPPSTSARPAAPGSAAPMRTPTACCASTSPRGPHWTASAPRGSNRCTINSTNDHANASAGKPLRKPTHTARCTSCEKPRAL